MREFDLYDFDKTVYPQDSETVFLFYCLFRRPCLLILAPYLLFNLILFFLGFGDKYKGKCFTFLRFIDGEKMFGEDYELCTVDMTHPNDLGFYKMATAIEPVLKEKI